MCISLYAFLLSSFPLLLCSAPSLVRPEPHFRMLLDVCLEQFKVFVGEFVLRAGSRMVFERDYFQMVVTALWS